MKKVNWGSITASKDGSFDRPPAGPYVVQIVEAEDNELKEYVNIVWDICEGEWAGHYSDDWGKEHPYAHNLVLSYRTEKALSMTKGRLEVIQECNPGFDPFAAIDAGRLDMLVGRKFVANLQEEEYEGNDGKVKTRLNVSQVRTIADLREGKVKTPKKKTLDGREDDASIAAEASSLTPDIEIPF